jgi:methionine-rich copper-binding protein CopC
MTHRLTALALAGLVTLALAGSVLGHAELVSADPPAGGTLTTTPYTLTATFDDELTANGSSIVVENGAGTVVASGTVSADHAKTMTVELPALPDGAYGVRWIAVSADDQAVERGTYNFSVGSAAPSATPASTPPPAAGATGSSTDVLIAIGLAAILILVIVAFIFVRGRR